MERIERARADVDRASAWGVVAAIVGVAALVTLIYLVGRQAAVIVLPLLLVAAAWAVARPGTRRRRSTRF
jgi:hypothetical protein